MLKLPGISRSGKLLPLLGPKGQERKRRLVRAGAEKLRPPDISVILEVQGFYRKDTEMLRELGDRCFDLSLSPNPAGISHW